MTIRQTYEPPGLGGIKGPAKRLAHPNTDTAKVDKAAALLDRLGYVWGEEAQEWDAIMTPAMDKE